MSDGNKTRWFKAPPTWWTEQGRRTRPTGDHPVNAMFLPGIASLGYACLPPQPNTMLMIEHVKE